MIALVPEARPLISKYRLDAIPGTFRVYGRDEVALVISGIGKTSAAAATTYLHMKLGGRKGAVWVNVGIAGHRRRAVGETILAEAIRDEGSKRSWSLRVPETALAKASVLTVDRPEASFETDDVYDMEAAGFYSTAIRFARPELVQCLKVISDNRETPARRIRARRIEELIAGRMDDVRVAVAATEELETSRKR